MGTELIGTKDISHWVYSSFQYRWIFCQFRSSPTPPLDMEKDRSSDSLISIQDSSTYHYWGSLPDNYRERDYLHEGHVPAPSPWYEHQLVPAQCLMVPHSGHNGTFWLFIVNSFCDTLPSVIRTCNLLILLFFLNCKRTHLKNKRPEQI